MNNLDTPAMWHVQDNGLTKREYFAAMALQGLCCDVANAEDKGYDTGPDQTAHDAVAYADALLRELEQNQ